MACRSDLVALPPPPSDLGPSSSRRSHPLTDAIVVCFNLAMLPYGYSLRVRSSALLSSRATVPEAVLFDLQLQLHPDSRCRLLHSPLLRRPSASHRSRSPRPPHPTCNEANEQRKRSEQEADAIARTNTPADLELVFKLPSSSRSLSLPMPPLTQLLTNSVHALNFKHIIVHVTFLSPNRHSPPIWTPTAWRCANSIRARPNTALSTDV